MSEDHLLASVARGDRHAFEELYRVYYRRLIRFLATRIPTSHSADEIIDDTFMVVWRCAGEFRRQSQVSTWIFGITYRVALKSLRRVSLLMLVARVTLHSVTGRSCEKRVGRHLNEIRCRVVFCGYSAIEELSTNAAISRERDTCGLLPSPRGFVSLRPPAQSNAHAGRRAIDSSAACRASAAGLLQASHAPQPPGWGRWRAPGDSLRPPPTSAHCVAVT